MNNCLTCGGRIPSWVKVDGKARNTSNRRRCFSCVPFKSGTRSSSYRITAKGTPVECAKCGRDYVFDHSKGHSLTHCNSCMANGRREKVKLRAIAYLGGMCRNCGYSRCTRALCFHHVDPSKKDFSLSSHSADRSWEVLRAELDKCVLLCANCHMEIHEEIDQRRARARRPAAKARA